jgi:hypothetical protein
MKKILLLISATILSISVMAQTSELKLKLEKNKVYRFKSVSSQNVSQTMNGVEQTTTTNSNSVMSLKMMDMASDLIVAEVKFDTIVTSTNTMGKLSVINSANVGNMASEEAGEVMSVVMNRLSKNALYVKMKPTGEVTEIVNLRMLQDIVLKDTGMISAKLAPMLKPQIKNTVEANALMTMINMYTFNLPAKEVKKGEQWNTTVPVNSGGLSLEISTNYKLEDLKGNQAFVKSESSIKAAANAAPLEYPGAKITYESIKGIGKSDMTFDTTTGILTDNITKTSVAGDLNVNAGGMSMQIPMKINGETSVKLLP